MGSPFQPAGSTANRVRIVVATSVMLTFISYWRAAAIVLNDLGSSAFYAAGIAEQAVGKSAPWFILGVMLFSFCVRAVYVESCSMFVRGGVYRVVKEALGGTLAKISVSALMFDYILTGLISGVSAGQYIAGLINDTMVIADTHGWVPRAVHAMFKNGTPHVNESWTAVIFAVMVTVYFWWQNTKGIQESSEKALRVMQITTVMVVILLGWSALTLMKAGYQPVPLPVPANLKFSPEALGFLKHTFQGQNLAGMFGLFGILIAFGHSVLAMSGEESLAQVNRELAHPKLKNLKRAAIIIAIYSFVFTGLTALLFVMIIPDSVRIPVYKDNLIAGLAMNLWGPQILRLVFRAFVVVVGFLVLLSTAIVNLFTKSIATVAGVSFAAVFFLIFTVSEKVNRRKHALAEQQMQEHFQLLQSDTVDRGRLGIRPGNLLVTIRDYNTLSHLKWALERIDTKEQDIVVMSARVSQFGAAAYDLATEQIFSDYEQKLFTRAVSVAESFGKHISLLVVPARDVWSAIVQTAINLESSAVVSGLSSKMTAQEQAFELGHAWEATPEPKRQFVLQIVRPDMKVDTFHIGPHTPSMKTEDVHLVHRLWLNITRESGLDNLHHHDILTEALTRFARDYAGRDKDDILKELKKTSGKTVKARPVAAPDGKPEKPLTPLRTEEDEPRDKSEKGPPSPPIVSP